MNLTEKLIKDLGGQAVVAKRLGYSKQRVHNWIARDSIPLQERVDHPDLFPLPQPKPPTCMAESPG